MSLQYTHTHINWQGRSFKFLCIYIVFNFRKRQSGRVSLISKDASMAMTYKVHIFNSCLPFPLLYFLGILHWYFKGRLEELSTIAAANSEDEDELGMDDKMDLDEKSKLPYKFGDMDSDINHKYAVFSENNKLVKNIGMVVRNLRNIGFTSMAEDAYASAIFFLLKVYGLQ